MHTLVKYHVGPVGEFYTGRHNPVRQRTARGVVNIITLKTN